MIHCKKNIIAVCFTLMLPLACWSEAPVIDDSDNFAMMDEQQAAYEAPVVNPKYDQPQTDRAQGDIARNDKYDIDTNEDDGVPLAKEDTASEPKNNFNNNAKLIDKVQSLQQEVQELRGQLEVQAHDLKLLQQQQVAFYKDLDSRLGAGATKSAQAKPPTDLNLGAKPTATQPTAPTPVTNTVAASAPPKPVVVPTSRMNPADEQISYLAAYELVKNKRFDDAIAAMQSFVVKYPQGGYSANAEYWLGELYLVKKDYPKSIEHFEVVLKQFPSSSKSAASLLKAGYAYAASGNNAEAKRRLEQVVRTYPDTPTAQLASSKLAAINSL